MYALLDSQGNIKTYPYSVNQLKLDNPSTSFPSYLSDDRLADWGVVVVVSSPQPTYTLITQNIKETTPINIAGVWTQTWEVTEASPEEIEQRTNEYNLDQKQNRTVAYTSEADPIFFKWQRGEATEQEWLDKVEEIKARYAYLNEETV